MAWFRFGPIEVTQKRRRGGDQSHCSPLAGPEPCPGPGTFSPELPAKMAGEFATLFARLANSPDAVTNNVKGIYGAKTASSPLRHGVRGPSDWSRREHPPLQSALG